MKDNEISLLLWPLQSPDLNPIDILWPLLKNYLEIHVMDKLAVATRREWDAIHMETLENLVESMPR